MMKLKTVMAASTAIALIAAGSMASAQSNEAFLNQSGNGAAGSRNNDASIIQRGANNSAGTATLEIIQTMSSGDNDLQILQSGDNNVIGTTEAARGGSVTQRAVNSGAGNELDIVQSSNNNTIDSIYQNADTAGSTINTLDVRQRTGNNNLVGDVDQNRFGAGAEGQIATIDQSGARNTINVLSQNGNGTFVPANLGTNEATLIQRGNRNVIDQVLQDGRGNVVSVEQRGVGNGSTGFGLPAALGVGVTQGVVSQTGENNTVDYLAVGNQNLFGFVQTGSDNTVGTVSIIGSGNETATLQTGDGNMISITPIVGNGNDIGIVQAGDGTTGDMNMASVALRSGSDNNMVDIDQLGSWNETDVTVSGDRNDASINLTGDYNGAGSFSGYADIGLSSSTIFQGGNNNLVDVNIMGDMNEYAVRQTLGSNTALITVSGSMNQVAALQTGGSNMAVVNQTGSGNIAGITQ